MLRDGSSDASSSRNTFGDQQLQVILLIHGITPTCCQRHAALILVHGRQTLLLTRCSLTGKIQPMPESVQACSGKQDHIYWQSVTREHLCQISGMRSCVISIE